MRNDTCMNQLHLMVQETERKCLAAIRRKGRPSPEADHLSGRAAPGADKVERVLEHLDPFPCPWSQLHVDHDKDIPSEKQG